MPSQRLLVPLVCSLFALASVSLAQQKKPLSHDVYDMWEKTSGESLTPDGTFLMYAVEPGEGDPRLIIQNLAAGTADTIARGIAGKFTPDSRFAAFTIKAPWSEIRKARNAKKKADEQPNDSLGIIDLSTRTVVRVPRVKSFKIPERGGAWMAYQLEKKIPDTTKTARGGKGDEESKKDDRGTTVVVRELRSGRAVTFDFVRGYEFAKSGSSLLVSIPSADSSGTPGVFRFSTVTGQTDTIARGKGKYSLLALDEGGNQAACVADRDTSKSKQRYPVLLYWKSGMDSSVVLADTLTKGMPPHWLVCDTGSVTFSHDAQHLFFGTAPVPMPDDTTLIEEETAKLDVWNWQDPLLQSQQLKELDAEKKRSYPAVVHLAEGRMVQMADSLYPTLYTVGEGDVMTGLLVSPLRYRRESSWEGGQRYDAAAIDITTGAKRTLLEGNRGIPSLSPGGKYIAWYDFKKRSWHAMPTAGGKAVAMTAGTKVSFANELSDVPDDPESYGLAGWLGKDSLLLIYDRFDIWEADPSGGKPTVCITGGAGRRQHQRFRYERLNAEEKYIPGNANLMLRVFDEKTKSEGFALLRTPFAAPPQQLVLSPCDYGTVFKAKEKPVLAVQRSTYHDPVNLYLGDTTFSGLKRLSDINRQQADYSWGNVELITWNPPKGEPLEGLLFTPEGFRRDSLYPMIVYYYERNSDLLYRYVAPAPSASTVNLALYPSRGYVVFVPDIRYRTGYPGQSAYDCIMSGVKAVVKRGGIDPRRIGLQGQSWGGYQTAYMVTRTHMFAAAMAGAAVSNMTSAYGGIRWESGLVRMFQYEHSQSRIGATLWERPDLYIANSPLFRADSVTTPLLMMNNDNDGAVPWYQGIEFFNALRRLDKPVWMLVYNGEEHNLMKRKNRKDLSTRMLQFFDHYLMGKPAPRWMTEGIPAINKGKTMGYDALSR